MSDRNIPPAIKEIDTIETASPDRLQMPNGIPVCLLNNETHEVIRLDLVFRGGRYHQQQPLQAALTNRLLREGTQKYTSAEISDKLDYYGAWLELYTSCECSYVTLYSLNKYVAQTLGVVSSIIKEPIFPEREIQTILEIHKQQFLINSRKVDFISQKYFNLALFGDQHPNGNTTVLGDFSLINQASLMKFHSQHYHSKNCAVYISGNVTPCIYEQIEDLFGKQNWGSGQQINETDFSLPDHTLEKSIFIDQTEAMQSSLKMGLLTINRAHPDHLKLRVVITLLGGYFGSRLMANIREKKGYTYGISANIHSYPDTGVFIISTEADNKYIESIKKEVYKEIEILKNQPVEQNELSMVKNYMIGNLCRDYEGILSMADIWILTDTEKLSRNYEQESLQAIKEITPEEIMNLARKYLDENRIIEVVSGKKTITNYNTALCLGD